MPLMTTGTPGRPGITTSKPPPATAGSPVSIKSAKANVAANPTRMGLAFRFPARISEQQVVGADAQGKKRERNLSQGADPSVKAVGQISGKPNAWSLERFPAKWIPVRVKKTRQ